MPRSSVYVSRTCDAVIDMAIASSGLWRITSGTTAARIAVGTVVSEISADARGIDRVVFCCFSQESAEHHVNAFAELGLA